MEVVEVQLVMLTVVVQDSFLVEMKTSVEAVGISEVEDFCETVDDVEVEVS